MSNSLFPTVCASCGQSYAAEALFCPACGTARSRHTDGDPLMGALLGERFLVIDRLGHGGSGTLYRGEHVTLRRKVAIKVLHHELSRDDMAVERFRREATTVSEIDNEHIVEILDFGRTPDGRLYLAMELLEGETLQDALEREQRLGVERTVDILIQLGEALMEAHAMGYVHRDLRPRNIYLATRRGRTGFVKLLDFGLAKLVETEGSAESTNLGMTFGDPKYMSPEQARGDALDRRADIYSLGCIAYEMLTGQPPFVGSKVFDILTRHVDSLPPTPRERRPEIPEWLDAAIMRMLAKRPEDRFITVYQLVEVMRQGVHASAAVVATSPGPAPAPTARRQPPTPTPVPGALPVSMPGSASRRQDDREASTQPVAAAATRTRRATEPTAMAVVNQARRTAAEPAQAASSKQDDAGEQPGAQVENRAVEQLAAVAGEPVASAQPVAAAQPVASAQPVAPAQPASASESENTDESESEEDKPDAEAERSADKASDSASGLSAAWFADGDDDLDERSKKRLDKARANLDPSDTSLIDGDLYYASNRSRMLKIAGVIGGLVLLIGVIALAWPSGKSKDKREDTQAAKPAATSAAATLAALERDAGAAAATAIDAGAAPASTAIDAGSTGKSPEPASSDSKSPDKSASKPPDPDTGTKAQDSKTSDKSKNPIRTPKPPEDDGLRDPYGNSGSSEDASSSTASSENAKKAEFYAKLGQQSLQSGDLGGAAGKFKQALELDPRNADAIMGQGEIAMRTGSYSQAITHLKKAARLRPRSSMVHTLLGEAYLATGKNTLAESSFKQALKLDADNKRAATGYNEAAGRLPPPTDDE